MQRPIVQDMIVWQYKNKQNVTIHVELLPSSDITNKPHEEASEFWRKAVQQRRIWHTKFYYKLYPELLPASKRKGMLAKSVTRNTAPLVKKGVSSMLDSAGNDNDRSLVLRPDQFNVFMNMSDQEKEVRYDQLAAPQIDRAQFQPKSVVDFTAFIPRRFAGLAEKVMANDEPDHAGFRSTI